MSATIGRLCAETDNARQDNERLQSQVASLSDTLNMQGQKMAELNDDNNMMAEELLRMQAEKESLLKTKETAEQKRGPESSPPLSMGAKARSSSMSEDHSIVLGAIENIATKLGALVAESRKDTAAMQERLQGQEYENSEVDYELKLLAEKKLSLEKQIR